MTPSHGVLQTLGESINTSTSPVSESFCSRAMFIYARFLSLHHKPHSAAKDAGLNFLVADFAPMCHNHLHGWVDMPQIKYGQE